jgi:hypothetical protein
LELAQNLPSGGKPPATDDEEGLRIRIFLDSTLDKDSASGTLLPAPLPCDKFYQKQDFIYNQ